MDEYISTKYLEKLLDYYLKNSNGAERYGYNIIKNEIEHAPIAGLEERGHIVTLFEKSQFSAKARGDYDVIVSTGTNEILDLAKLDGLPPIIQQFHTDPKYPFRHWIKHWTDNNLIGHEYEECSICGCSMLDTNQFWDSLYCPNCGAKMW